MMFDPAVAYRILVDKQQRLYDQAGRLTWNTIYKRVQGKIDYAESDRILAQADKIREEASRMWDVLDYLRNRMDEEK